MVSFAKTQNARRIQGVPKRSGYSRLSAGLDRISPISEASRDVHPLCHLPDDWRSLAAQLRRFAIEPQPAFSSIAPRAPARPPGGSGLGDK